MRTVETIKNWLEDLDEWQLISVWNEYQQNNYFDGEIYSNVEEFFEMFFDGKVMEAIRAVNYGDYNYQHKYVKFNGYGNLETFDYLDDEIDFDELAEHIFENEHEYSYLDGLEDYYDEDEEDEESEEE